MQAVCALMARQLLALCLCHAAGNVTQGLDFGGIPLLLYLEPGSGLVLRHVNVSGTGGLFWAQVGCGLWPRRPFGAC